MMTDDVIHTAELLRSTGVQGQEIFVQSLSLVELQMTAAKHLVLADLVASVMKSFEALKAACPSMESKVALSMSIHFIRFSIANPKPS